MPKMNRFVALEKSLEAARAALMSPLGFVDGNLPPFRKEAITKQKRVRFAGALNLLAFSAHSHDKISETRFCESVTGPMRLVSGIPAGVEPKAKRVLSTPPLGHKL